MKQSIIKLIEERILNLIKVILKPSFLTWVFITYIILWNKQSIDLNYYVFTAGIIGMSKFFNNKKSEV